MHGLSKKDKFLINRVMKKIVLLLVLLATSFCYAQDTITNSIDTNNLRDTRSSITYDFENGEVEGTPIESEVNLALIPINSKDDLKDIPAGLREKVTRRVFSVNPIPNNATITTLFDNVEFNVIVPSQPMTAGGMVHCYRTYIGEVETSLGTVGTLLDE